MLCVCVSVPNAYYGIIADVKFIIISSVLSRKTNVKKIENGS